MRGEGSPARDQLEKWTIVLRYPASKDDKDQKIIACLIFSSPLSQCSWDDNYAEAIPACNLRTYL